MTTTFSFPSFQVHPALAQQHVQTIFGTVFPRRFSRATDWRASGQRREFTMADGDRLSAILHVHPSDPERQWPLVVILSGLEGHVDTHYMHGLSSKAFAAGYHSLRLNYRTCGGTEHLANTFYNAGLIADVDAVLRQLASEGSWPIVVMGVSLGANKVLRLLGTYGETPPPWLLGGVAISPPIELAAANHALGQGFNKVYDAYFLRSMKQRLRRKLALATNRPEELDRFRQGLQVATVKAFDDVVTAPLAGFADAMAYYDWASTGDLLKEIRVPTLLIHADDDPLIVMDVFDRRKALIAGNPHLTTVFTQSGGHVGFIQAPTAPRPEPWMDDYWAENAAIAYMRWLAG